MAGIFRTNQRPAVTGTPANAGYPSYRYYRFTDIEERSGGSYLDLNELALWHSGSRVTGGTYTTSGGFNASAGLNSLGDGVANVRSGYWDRATYFNVSGFYIQIDFGSAQAVSSWRFSPANDSARGFSKCTLRGSSDGSSFVALQSFSGLASVTVDTLSADIAIAEQVAFPPYAPVGTIAVAGGQPWVCTEKGSPGTWKLISAS
jgi:hypothetical protein